MILADALWLTISIRLLLVIFVLVCLVMSMLILMQRPKNEGLGAAFGSGATDQLFGARTTNVLQKGTVYLATVFFVLTLTLAVLIAKRNADRTTLVADVPVAEAPAEEAPVDPEDTSITPEAVTEPVEVPAAEDAPAPSTVEEATPEIPAAEEEPAPDEAAPETPATDETPDTETPAETQTPEEGR